MAVARAAASPAQVAPAALGEPGVVTIEASAGPGIAAAINAALADPSVTKVVLGAGTFLLEAPINIPSGKTLEGAGRDLTMLKVGEDFARPGSGEEDGVVNSVRGSENVTVTGFSIDAGHVYPEGFRLHGCFMKDTTNFSVSEVDVYNSTGYAHFAAGTQGVPGFYTSGNYDDCETFSSSIHFEQMFCDGVTLTNCHASDGDGVLRGIYFHPVLGSKNISYIDCSAYGTGVGVEMTADYILSLENISFIRCDIEITSDSMALFAGGAMPHLNVQIIDSRFVSHNQIAVILRGVTGTIENSYIQGESSALVALNAANGFESDIVGINSVVLGTRDPSRHDSVSAIVAVTGAGTVHWIGGTVEARGMDYLTHLFIGGAVTHTPETKLITSGYGTMLFYTEGDAPKTFAPPLVIGDVGAAGFDGATFTVSYLANDTIADQLTISGSEGGAISVEGGLVRFNGTEIGTVSGGENGTALLVTLNGAATGEAVTALSQAIGFTNSSENPDALYRALAFTLKDSSGAAAQTSAALIMTPVDDAAELAGAAPLAYLENDAAAALLPGAILTDVDSSKLGGGSVTVTFGDTGTADDILTILHAGFGAGMIGTFNEYVTFGAVLLGTFTGGTGTAPLVISLAPDASMAGVQALLRAIAYQNGSDAPVDGARTVTVQLQAASGAVTTTSVPLTVISVEDPLAPSDDAGTVAEGASLILHAAANDDLDGPAPAIVSVAGTALQAGEKVILASGATVTLNADNSLTYDAGSAFASLVAAGSGASNTVALDTFAYEIAGGGTATVRVTVNGMTGAGDVLLGSVSDDILVGSSLAETFRLDQGGADHVSGGSGDDVVFLGASMGSRDAVNGGAGDDVVTLQGQYGLAFGASSLVDVERLELLSGAALDWGLGGSDVLTYDLTTHDLNVAAGSTLTVGFAGLAAGEHVYFNGAAETDGTFVFEGGAGDDILIGGAGSDYFAGGAGANRMTGGAGDDVYLITSAADEVTEADGGGVDEVRTALGSRSDLEALFQLPDHVEKLTGTSGSGQGVHGNARDNVIVMGAGGDLVVLEQGGLDRVDGGGGNDFLYYGAAFTADDLNEGGDGYDTLGLLGTYDLILSEGSLSGIEKLALYSAGTAPDAVANSYAVRMNDANVAAGAELMVVAASLQANETLTFDGSLETDGRFNVRGGRGSDTITGGHGNDILWGNQGADLLRGGAGNDQFEYRSAPESTAEGADTILDFGAGDKINLIGIDADGNSANGNGGFHFIGSAAFSGASRELRVSTGDDGSWLVEGDIDGDGAADLTIIVQTANGHAITHSDFWF
jgi:Ca2+-binding RTX toxin-like protein